MRLFDWCWRRDNVGLGLRDVDTDLHVYIILWRFFLTHAGEGSRFDVSAAAIYI